MTLLHSNESRLKILLNKKLVFYLLEKIHFWCCLVFSLVPGVFGNQQQQHLGMIKAMLTSSLADSGNPPVQALAVKATAAFILLHDNEPNIQRNFADLLQPFLQVLVILICPSGYCSIENLHIFPFCADCWEFVVFICSLCLFFLIYLIIFFILLVCKKFFTT